MGNIQESHLTLFNSVFVPPLFLFTPLKRVMCVCVCVLGQYPTEEDMIEWAKRESEREEKERLARLTQQEQEDLELAIALSKSELSWEPGSAPHGSELTKAQRGGRKGLILQHLVPPQRDSFPWTKPTFSPFITSSSPPPDCAHCGRNFWFPKDQDCARRCSRCRFIPPLIASSSFLFLVSPPAPPNVIYLNKWHQHSPHTPV